MALVGPSGAGKSTLIRLLNGSLSPTQGQVRAFGLDLTQLSMRRLRKVQQRIGTVYQQYHLVDNLPVIHNLNAGRLGRWSFARALFSLVWPVEVSAAQQALVQVGIPEKLYERTDTLSGGQQQRVALARVFIQNPDVILADEPISSVDPERSREMMDLLRNQAGQGKTLIVSLHAIEFAFSHLDRMIGLQKGQVLLDAPSSAVTPSMIQDLYQLT
ncbi:MAG TPA: ATP-binding cassette domain-containing protein [Anaerolineaceae bacterium]|nr:ATP-binding cassette domain-containing protein [Anaerolineaceae bacterium]